MMEPPASSRDRAKALVARLFVAVVARLRVVERMMVSFSWV